VEEREFIQILVVEAVKKISGFFFQEAKVNNHPLIVQMLRFDSHLHFKVMAMKGFAFSPYFLKAVGGRKFSLDLYFVHFLLNLLKQLL